MNHISRVQVFYGFKQLIHDILLVDVFQYIASFYHIVQVSIYNIYTCNSLHHARLSNRVGKYRDICENIKNIENIRYFRFFRYFRYIYQAFAHTLLKLCEIYYQIIVCVCVHCILGEVLLLFTLHCCGEVKFDRSCPTLRKC